jgi:hypothetical protein
LHKIVRQEENEAKNDKKGINPRMNGIGKEMGKQEKEGHERKRR